MKLFRTAALAAVDRHSSTHILLCRGALVRGAVTLAMCGEAAPGGDLDLTDEAVELITDRVGEALELPFIPVAFQQLFLQQMAQIVLLQLGPEMQQQCGLLLQLGPEMQQQ